MSSSSSSFIKSWPRSLRVLVAPHVTFREVAESGTGFGFIFVLLAIEYLLIRPLEVVTQVLSMSFRPVTGLWELFQRYAAFALPLAVAVFVSGVVLYYALRWWGPIVRGERRRLELWAAASVVTYAWVPHTLLVALSALVAHLGWDHAAMPHNDLRGSDLWLAVPIGFVPSFIYAGFAVRSMWRTDEPPPARRVPVALVVAVATLLIASFAGTSHYVSQNWQDARPLMPGDRLPHFNLPGLDTSAVDSHDLHGDVLLLDFWASWCPPCVAAMPDIEELHRELSGRGFRLVSINADEDATTIRNFAKQQKLSFPIYMDSGHLQQRFQVQSLPSMFLVDHRGVVIDAEVGTTSPKTLRQRALELLDERVASVDGTGAGGHPVEESVRPVEESGLHPVEESVLRPVEGISP